MSGGRGRAAWTAPPGGHCLPALPGSGRAARRQPSVRPVVGKRRRGRPTPAALSARLAALFPGAPRAWPGLPRLLEGTERD